MALNIEQIVARGIVQDPKEDRNPRATSRYLTVGTIIGSDGKEKDSKAFTLEPQKMIIVISSERVQMPRDVFGYTMPRTTLHNRGVLALATGIVDPGYSGPISSTLINFGRQAYSVRQGDRFLRLTFHYADELEDETLIRAIESSRGSSSIPTEEYIEVRKKTADRFPDTFLDIPRHALEIAKEVVDLRTTRTQILLAWGAVIAAVLTFLLAVIVFLGAPFVSDLTSERLSEEAAARIIAEVDDAPAAVSAEEIESLQEDVQALEDRVEEFETDQPG